MKLLFIHPNFPSQFVHLAAALGRERAHTVVALSQHVSPVPPGVTLRQYGLLRQPAGSIDPIVAEHERSVMHAQACAVAALKLKNEGFTPDVIVAHPGWGEAMFVKDVFPATPLLTYFEFFYSATGADVGFDPEFPTGPESAQRLRVRNMPHLAALSACDAGLTPTRWQQSTLPREYRGRVAVSHEGIDTDAVRPDPAARFEWQGSVFEAGQPVVTYVARNLEPYRGIHVFLRALPALLAAAPDAQVLVVGGDDVSYGQPAPHPLGWRAWLTEELANAGTPLDAERVHFVGKLPHAEYVKVLQVSAAHVYLTYPFVLSWSMLEAMSAGALVIGSATAPVQEVIVDGENGRLVDFFDRDALVATIVDALRDPTRGRALREAARATVVQRYDLKRCVPATLKLIRALAGQRSS